MILRDIPYSAIKMPIYETLKNRSIRLRGGMENLSTADQLLNGFIAGAIASFLTTPIDVIKTFKMTDRSTATNISFSQTFKAIYKDAGFAGFFKAWHIRSVNVGISGAFFFWGYEIAKSGLENVMKK